MPFVPHPWLLSRILRPVTRMVAGLIAIPLFRLLRRKIAKLDQLDAELEKDIDEWFRASVVLLLATANVEQWLFDFDNKKLLLDWLLMAGRLLLAMGVIESMPDQALFSIIHPGPPRPHYDRRLGLWGSIRTQFRPMMTGLLCKHLNRSSPIFVILAAIYGGVAGWIFYGLAVVQYLIIGLVTSRDKALDVLSQFDRQVALRRQEIIEEFAPLEESPPVANKTAPEAAAGAPTRSRAPIASPGSDSGEISLAETPSRREDKLP